MSRPEVSLDNLDFYDYYEQHTPNRAFTRAAYFAMARKYQADITADNGLAESIEEELDAGSRLLLSPNHLTDHDQNVAVALVERYKPLHDLRGNTFIPAKSSLFTQPGIKGKLLRYAVDELGALPAIRKKEVNAKGEEVDDRYDAAILRSSEVQVTKIVEHGFNMAAYWENTRNKQDFKVVQDFKKGVGHTAIAATKRGVRMLMLPIGVYYGGEPEDYDKPVVPDLYTPKIHLGSLIPIETTNVDELISQLHPAVQRAVCIAVARTAEAQP